VDRLTDVTFAVYLHVVQRVHNNLKQFHVCKMLSYYGMICVNTFTILKEQKFFFWNSVSEVHLTNHPSFDFIQL
jgi:hypothetical protein